MTSLNTCHFLSKPEKSEISSEESRPKNTWPPILYSHEDGNDKKCTHLGCYVWCNICHEEEKKSSVPKSFANRTVRNSQKMWMDMSRHEQDTVKYPVRSSNPWNNLSTKCYVPCLPNLKVFYESTTSQWLVDEYYNGMCIHMNNAIWCKTCGNDAIECSAASEETLDRHHEEMTDDPPSNTSESVLIPSAAESFKDEKISSMESISGTDEASTSDIEDTSSREQEVPLEFSENEMDEENISEIHGDVQTNRIATDLVVPLRRNTLSFFDVQRPFMFLFKNVKWFLMFLLVLFMYLFSSSF